MLSEFKPFTLFLGNGLKTFEKPMVMGILNTTGDSFFDGGKYHTIDLAIRQTDKMLGEGADIIDIGGQSSRPGADMISTELEITRTADVIAAVRKKFPQTLISIDTFRSEVARRAIDSGADIVNDISAGDDDPEMIVTVANLKVPYIAMHKKGIPKTMQDKPEYVDVVKELESYFDNKVEQFRNAGIDNVILDPGFGFGKTLKNNYEIMNRLEHFHRYEKPLLIGISRKTMIWKLLETDPEGALNGTTVLNTIALMKGASILRVHDVKEAVECVKICGML